MKYASPVWTDLKWMAHDSKSCIGCGSTATILCGYQGLLDFVPEFRSAWGSDLGRLGPCSGARFMHLVPGVKAMTDQDICVRHGLYDR